MQPSMQRNIRVLIAVSVMLTSGLAVLVWAIRLEPRTAVAAQLIAPAAATPAIPADIHIPAALLRVSAGGDLMVDGATAQALDSVHAALSQRDDRAALSRLVNQLRQTPGGAAGHQAATLLMHYHEYRKRMVEMSAGAAAADPAEADAIQHDQARLRAAYFSPRDAAVLFGDDAAASGRLTEPRLAGRNNVDQ